jgi:hypothetical protein
MLSNRPRWSAFPVLLLSLAAAAVGACARTTASGDPRVTVIGRDERAAPQGGIAPDKEQEILLVLQQRQVSTSKCYQDVLNQKQDRSFAGSMKVLIGIGTTGQASDVRVVGGTLTDQEVAGCLIETIKAFEFPKLEQAGEVQYEFQFRPAY